MRSSLTLLINLLGIEYALGDHFNTARRDLAKKAGLVTFVAGRAADLFDFQKHGVGIAIDVDLADVLHVAAFLAFAPQPSASAAKIHRPAARERLIPGLAVHVGDHEHLAGYGVLGNGRDQAVCSCK